MASRAPRSAADVLNTVKASLPSGCKNVLRQMPKVKTWKFEIERKIGFYTFRAECFRALVYTFKDNDLGWYAGVGGQLTQKATRLALAGRSSIASTDWHWMVATYLNLHPKHNLRVASKIIAPLLGWAIEEAETRGFVAISRKPKPLPTPSQIRKLMLKAVVGAHGTKRDDLVRLGPLSSISGEPPCLAKAGNKTWTTLEPLAESVRVLVRSNKFRANMNQVHGCHGCFFVSNKNLKELALVGDALFGQASSLVVGSYAKNLPLDLRVPFFNNAMKILNSNLTMGTILETKGYFNELISEHAAGTHFEALFAIFHELNLENPGLALNWVQKTFQPVLELLRKEYVASK